MVSVAVKQYSTKCVDLTPVVQNGTEPLEKLGRQTLINDNFTCRVSLHGRCHICFWLVELTRVVLSCSTLSRQTVLPDVSLIKPEDIQLIAYGNALFSVVGQKICEYMLQSSYIAKLMLH